MVLCTECGMWASFRCDECGEYLCSAHKAEARLHVHGEATDTVKIVHMRNGRPVHPEALHVADDTQEWQVQETLAL